MRVAIDLDLCVASGSCVMTAPDVFDQDPDDGRATLRTAEPGPEQLDAITEAVALCPSGALSLIPKVGEGT
jgi:ferredoxin